MSRSSHPLWPAVLDHLRIDSPEPRSLARFYRDVLGYTVVALADDLFLLEAPQRRLLVGRGERGAVPFNAWALAHDDQLQALRRELQAREVPLEVSPTPLFAPGAFAARDPDGRLAVFGRPVRPETDATAIEPAPARPHALPARLQHAVVATPRLEAMRAFYGDRLGFAISDVVYTHADGEPVGAPHVFFFRADPEHHSLAVFAGSSARHDHHCYETTCWNDIRDWLDHLGDLDIAPWWGPGRHGPGHNLFFMIKDPDGNNIELSAELEQMTRVAPPRHWPNSRRMYNHWGVSWNRD